MVGNRTRVKVVKNKLAPPFREVEFDILYGKGISREGDLIDLGVTANLIEKSGAWYSYNGERIGQGREAAKQYLVEHPEIGRALENALRAQSGLTVLPESAPRPAEKAAANGRSHDEEPKRKSKSAMA